MHRLMSIGIVLLGLFIASIGAAQERDDGLASRAPRFFRATADSPVPVDVRRTPVLLQRISVDLDGITLKEALAEISRRANLPLMYSRDVIPLDSRVRLRAENITVAGALSEVLVDAGVDVLLSDGRAALVKRAEAVVPPAHSGSVMGRVTDGKTGNPLGAADVLLEGTKWRTATGDDGRFRLAEVAAGSYTLTVRRIGYAKQSQPMTVGEGAEVTADVALQPVPTKLDEIVTTVTGEQRLRELGHVVGRINADSVVKAAPVASVAELLNGRVPGLQVFTNSGMVGGTVSLQVRSPNSISLGTEPIVIVDGIRYTSGTRGNAGPFNVEQTSRLNDLNPNDIESIEVVKGPSAATLYGTDASNGVIVITTKRGRPGPARWNAYARSSVSEIPEQRYPEAWWGWRTVGGVPSLTSSCTLENVAQGTCVQDSVTVLPNPLNDPSRSMFASKPRWEYGANVSGGQQDFRYYFSADFERALGPIQMPEAAVEQLEQQRGVAELPAEQLEPNAFTKMNLRANVTAALGPTAELQINTGYGHNATRTLSGHPFPAYKGGATGTPADPYGRTSSPEELFAQSSTERVDRFFGSATGQWRPWAWLQARGTVGLDLVNTTGYSLARPSETIFFATGFAGDDRARQLGITGDLGLTALARRGRLSFRTSVGAQYVRSLANALMSSGTGLPPGGESVGQAATRSVIQSYSETVTLGSYLEETVGLNDRLFLTGALRVDGASAFGRNYEAAAYPKASVSWILSEEPFLPRVPGLEELRLRYAFGASGQQALSSMTLPTFIVSQTTLDGTATNRINLSSLGNPNLRPERVREHEVGLDATGLDGRLQLGLTWFQRRTTDQILSRPLQPGFGSAYTNLGLVTGRGFEAELTARLVETRQVSWQVSLQHSLRRSRLVDLGDVSPFEHYVGGYVEGYPLGARFARPIVSYADANGDGILRIAEVQLGEAVYLGESTAPQSQTLSTVVGLFQQRLRLSALVERRSGFTQVDELSRSQCTGSSSRCRAEVDPSTPLVEQAEAVMAGTVPRVESGDFTRLREVTAALELPAGLVQAVRLRSATFSVAARNLALWTAFSGPDPESAPVSGFRGGLAGEIPQARSWVFRLDLGL